MNQWKREEARIKRGDIQLTDFCISAIYPESWNKMRVKYAQSPFWNKTLSEEINFYAVILNCQDEINKQKLTEAEIEFGMSFETKCSNILVMKSQEANNFSLFHNSGISCLQFRAYVGAL